MKIWKRNAVVAAIVLFVCLAVYLNWSYDNTAKVMGNTSQPAAEHTLGEAELVSAQGTLEQTAKQAADSARSEDPLTPEDLAAGTGNYFDTARLNREEARDSALSILQKTVDDPDADKDAVTTASESITAMAAATLSESKIESLVNAKGYADCVAFIGENSVSVVVSKAGEDLQAADIAKITDIVCGETGVSASGVKVITAE